MGKITSALTNNVTSYFRELLYFAAFVKVTVIELFLIAHRKQVVIMVLLRQILFTGYEALKLIAMVGLAIGAAIIIQGMALLDTFGQSGLVYNILIIVITKELGPLLTAFIIIARSGTAISTELGNMVVSNEIEALVSFGINPISYLVVPRVLGMVLSFFALSIYFNIAGLLGGYVVSAAFYPIPFTEFFSNLLSRMTIKDIVFAQVKAIVFGMVIAIISCYHGLQVQFASTEVPWRTIQAVVASLSWIIIFNILLTVLSYSF